MGGQTIVRTITDGDLVLVDFVNDAPNVKADASVLWVAYKDLNQPDNPMLIQATAAGAINRFIVRNNGQVVIGVDYPAEKLEIAGKAKATAFVSTSDKRWKTNIKPLQGSSDKVVRLQGVSYEWNTKDYPDKGFDDQTQIGFVAQDVEPVLPELVSTDKDGYKSMSYDKMTAVLVEAIKELKAENEALNARLKALESKSK